MASSDKTARKQAEREQAEQEELMLFEKDNSDEQRGGQIVSGKKSILVDDDYTYENRNYHRVRNYSFARP